MKEKIEFPNNEAVQSALEASSDQDLRVPCYCEENIYRLAVRKLKFQEEEQDVDSKYYVIFVSSDTQCVPMYYQLASQNPLSACSWDYHVLLLKVSQNNDKSEILDIDSHLPYPCSLEAYVQNSFPSVHRIATLPQYAPLFRVISAEKFLHDFCSDRRHMFREDGSWSAKPPTYGCIQQQQQLKESSSSNEGIFNLDSYRIMHTPNNDNSSDFSFESAFGQVLTREQLLEHFKSKAL
mmetsp:Transcript_40959/g.46535  ORF Transcript_40959/g.46535 Transcript_40959/m.46535 type:complete len:237 (-) Transcript_40959:11-721(-)